MEITAKELGLIKRLAKRHGLHFKDFDGQVVLLSRKRIVRSSLRGRPGGRLKLSAHFTGEQEESE